MHCNRGGTGDCESDHLKSCLTTALNAPDARSESGFDDGLRSGRSPTRGCPVGYATMRSIPFEDDPIDLLLMCYPYPRPTEPLHHAHTETILGNKTPAAIMLGIPLVNGQQGVTAPSSSLGSIVIPIL